MSNDLTSSRMTATYLDLHSRIQARVPDLVERSLQDRDMTLVVSSGYDHGMLGEFRSQLLS